MSELIDKPQKGFQTPYQLILDLTADRVLSRINNENILEINLADRWLGILEDETDITVPVEMLAQTEKAHWKLTVTSAPREVVTTPVRFHTFTLGEYLKEVLRHNFKNYGRSKITEEGFYYTSEGENILAIKSTGDFTNGIRHAGIEFTPSMYSVSKDRTVIFIDMPVVKGELHIIYIT